MAGMTGRTGASIILLAVLAATPAAAQEMGDSGRVKETCAEVKLDGDFRLKIPWPPGTRDFLQQLPRPVEPAPRRDIVIDPKWPHDQAMLAEHDWPHDWAMIVPQTDAEEEAVPLLDDFLGLVKPYLSNNGSEDGRKGGWDSESGLEQTAD